ncbi:hypothetical protein CDEST_14347 [Colletotrichum destructivum]|uniref:Uncharacterized protein n=1 Tax=Colletotrichum destructivum TaxID=34406 RepID=A0AAX4J1P5_9PEZI|nr:hypothetical protein CDEST_14347 [Colletotrichum destructivum]
MRECFMCPWSAKMRGTGSPPMIFSVLSESIGLFLPRLDLDHHERNHSCGCRKTNRPEVARFNGSLDPSIRSSRLRSTQGFVLAQALILFTRYPHEM